MIYILDTNILILLVQESEPGEEAYRCKNKILDLMAKGYMVLLPEICVFEVIRGIRFLNLKSGTPESISRKSNVLRGCLSSFIRLPLNGEVLDEAATIWAEALYHSKTRPKGVDVDLLILAHLNLERKRYQGRTVTVITKNLKDFRLFNNGDAVDWEAI